VSDTAVEQFFGVLRKLSKRAQFTLIPFDSTVDKENVVEWKRNQTPVLKRTRSGGTSFDCVNEFVNSVENRGRWDGFLILSDGECSDPGPSRLRRGWVICPNHKLLFATKDMHIQMTEPGKKASSKGAVR
jgi:predicted metal-dependent peptidase